MVNHSKRDDWNYRMIVTRNGTAMEGAFFDPHFAKSVAGMLIHNDNVSNVVVVDVHGKAGFYMRKDENGHVIQDKTVNVQSDEIRARFEINEWLRDAGIPIDVETITLIE